jgi:hypothetical protein
MAVEMVIMEQTCSSDGRDEEYMQNFGGNPLGRQLLVD